jgi:3-keto-disaccharide hydrolase
MKKIMLVSTMIFIVNGILAQSPGDPKLTEVWQPEPKVIAPGKTSLDAPSDAIILFNGKDLSQWQHVNGNPASWLVINNYIQCKPGSGNIQTKKGFGDCQLHIEWRTPDTAKGEGQERGNSGIFFMGRYELQVLDSYHNRTYSNGQAGSIFKQYMPLVNVCRGPGEWQTYDVIFTAPRFNADSTLKSVATITVLQNGVLIQNNVSLWGGTEYIGIPKYKMHGDRDPLILQEHGNTVKYRNIWIREL